jgi:ribosomal 50S subunit-recycling heat shock protein
VAKEVSDAGRIQINGRVAKASSEVQVGDELTIKYGQRTISVRLLQLLENPRKELAAQMYELLGGEPLEDGLD